MVFWYLDLCFHIFTRLPKTQETLWNWIKKIKSENHILERSSEVSSLDSAQFFILQSHILLLSGRTSVNSLK